MKLFLHIFTILFVLSAQVYVSYRIWHLLPTSHLWKNIATILYNFSIVSLIIFFAGAFGSGKFINFSISKVFYEIGTSAIFVLLFLFITFLAIDLLRLVRVLPHNFVQDSLVGTIGVTALMLVLFVGGNVHYYNKKRTTLELTTTKKLKKPVKMVMMSDLHLGYHNERSEFAKWVDTINKENPDFVLIAGDLVDCFVTPLLEQNVAEEFHRIKAPVYACMGNHEYIGGANNAYNFFKLAGINILQDSTAVLEEYGVAIVGRDDRTNKRRASIDSLLTNVDKERLYTILLDHQPFHLDQAEKSGIDFQFSGHTHYGQVWPITYIIDNMYEDGYGPWQRGNTYYYVSSGMGIWGGKFRIGTHSEYVVAELRN